MKKVAIIVLTVFVLIGITIYADRATRVQGKSNLAQNISGNPATGIKAGTPEPDLKLKTIDGKEVLLTDYKGKVVFVNFWSTWCDPCRVEIPCLIAMQNKYGTNGFNSVAIPKDK